MLVVSDSSALSNLALIGRLDLLREQFTKILIPTAVSRELPVLPDEAARLVLGMAVGEGWLVEKPLPGGVPNPHELQGLDPGETETLRLALAISADRVLMDERDGRRRVEALGIRAIGVLGVLLSAKRSESIASLKMEMTRLRDEAGFFISRGLERQVLAMAGE